MPRPATDKPCRIALVEDHTFMRDGVKAFIARVKDFECAWMATTAAEAETLLKQDVPDLLVVDLTLPDRNGLDLIKDVHDRHPKLPVIVLTMHDEKLYAQRALKAGARGYLRKDSSHTEFEAAFRRVMSGGISVSDSLTEGILLAYATGGAAAVAPKNGLETLTDRELQVFQMLGEGQTTHEVAAALNISPKTVDVHKMNMKTKLGLQDGSALVSMAIRLDEAQRLGDQSKL